MAGLRSKHNTYMSVPLVLAMVSNHYPTIYGSDLGWLFLIGFVLDSTGYGELTGNVRQRHIPPIDLDHSDNMPRVNDRSNNAGNHDQRTATKEDDTGREVLWKKRPGQQ